MKKTITFVLISFVLGLVVGLQRCNTSPEVISSIQYDSTAVYSTIEKPKPEIIRKDSTILNLVKKDSIKWRLIQKDSLISNIEAVVDSIYSRLVDSLLLDYSFEKSYCDTMRNDTDMFLVIWAIVQYNRIQKITQMSIIRRPTQINQYNYDEKNRYYLGAYVSRNYKGTAEIGISGGVGTNRYYFGGSIGTDAVLLTIQRKFNFKK